jgi:hypothetical protein
MNSKPLRVLAPVLALLLVTACGSMGGSQRSPRDQTLYTYVSAVRWSDFEAARTFVDPEVLRTDPVTDFEMERYKQIQVAGYEVKGASERGQPQHPGRAHHHRPPEVALGRRGQALVAGQRPAGPRRPLSRLCPRPRRRP